MADDQVKYSDLIYDDNKGFESLLKALGEIKTKLSEVKEEAVRLGGEIKNMGTVTSEQQKAVSAHAAAMEKLHSRASELTEEEAKAIKFLADSLNFMTQNGNKNMNVWKNMTQSMNGFNMSYNQMKETVKVLEQALKSLNTEQQKHSEGAKSAAAAVVRLKEAMKDFESQTKLSKEAVEKTSRAYSKLTESEIQSLEQLKAALAGTTQEQMAAVQSINIQSKSYNELYQTYNAIKDVLNGMTVAERENTEAGKLMVDRAKEIRDTLNNLQQQTGNYTLNVGNYASAMNGLKFQFQQLMREVPSAQNIQQFFLAISNNIPQFADALARYKKELPEIRDQFNRVSAEITRQRGILDTLVEGSTEHEQKLEEINELVRRQEELQKLNISPIKAIGKALLSWQTLLIAGLLLLRKMPDIVKAIAKWWDRWRNGVKEVKNEMTSVAAIARMQADVIKKTADEVTELRLIVDRLKDVKQGTDEWAAGVKTVNDITKSNLDTTKATPAEVEKVTAAYIKQAQQLAKNAVLTDMIAKSQANQSLRDIAYKPGTYGTARQALGLEIDSKEEKEFRELFTKMNNATKAVRDKERKKVWKQVTDAAGNATMKRVYEEEGEAGTNRRKEMNNAIQDYRNFINKRLEVLSPEAIEKLEKEYELIDPLKAKKDKSGKTYSLKDVDFLESELLDKDAVIELESSFERRLAMLEEEQLKERLVLKEKYEKELKDLEFNHEKHLITDKEYNEQRAKLDKNYNDLIKTNYEGNFEEMGVIQRKYWNKRNALTEKEAKRQEEEAEKTAKAEAKARYKALADEWQMERTQMVERGAKRKELIEAEITAEVARLNAMLEMERSVNGEMMSEEEEAKIREWITLLEQFKAAGNFNQINVGQIFGNGASNIGKKGRGNYTNIVDLLFGDSLTKDQQSSLSSVFDQAKEALNSWMDARKAAADQAKELADDEVSAAEQALNREIELRNQGYANDVALRERELADAKKAQKEAAMEQQKIAKEQVLLDAAMQASSMITASANILKNFPNPGPC